MKTTTRMLFLGAVMCFTGSTAFAQGVAFQNLDFEEGPVYYPPPSDYPVYPDVLPYWTVQFNDVVQPGAGCNNVLLDYQAVSLLSVDGLLGPDFVIAGDRSVYLQSVLSNPGDPTSTVNVSISQTAIVPSGAEWLVFDARNPVYGDDYLFPPGPFAVTLGGTQVPMIPIESNGGDVRFAGNIAVWAGQTTELSIGVLTRAESSQGWAVLDSVRFEVPEPTSVALLGLGLLGMCWRQWRVRLRP